jgi:putative sigma-54 modulation protein
LRQASHLGTIVSLRQKKETFMNIHINGRHFDLTDALKNHINDRLAYLESHFEKLMEVHVVLHKERENHIAEATMHIAHMPNIHAKAETSDMYASVDMMIDKLKHQIQKHKEKELTERDHGE